MSVALRVFAKINDQYRDVDLFLVPTRSLIAVKPIVGVLSRNSNNKIENQAAPKSPPPLVFAKVSKYVHFPKKRFSVGYNCLLQIQI